MTTERRRTKQCIKCLKHNQPGIKACTHCGELFKTTPLTRIIKKLRRFFDMVGQKKLG